MNEFKVGERVTLMLLNGVRRITTITHVIGKGVYEVTGGGIVSTTQLLESDDFKPIFEEP